MPVERVLSAALVPVPFHAAPQAVDAFSQGSFRRGTFAEVLPHAEKALDQERRLDQVPAIVVAAERFDPAGGAFEPVRPGSMEAVGLLQERHDVCQALGPSARVMNPRSMPTSRAMTPKPVPPEVTMCASWSG